MTRRFVILFVALICVLAANSIHAAEQRHVILITIDGFPAYMMKDPAAPIPTLRKLAREGAWAPDGMRVSNPAVTWPNHTTLVTGAQPEKHSVFFNGVLVRKGAGVPADLDKETTKAQLVAIPTVYDVLHGAGLRTAGINWPCTRTSGTLHDDFPDSPNQLLHTTPALRQELVKLGWLADETQASWDKLSGAAKDQVWTAAAAHVIRTRKPNFMAFHMLICDSIHHKYGAQSPASYAAVALADSQIASVLAAVKDAGIAESTTLFIVSDHGFEKALKIVQPNVLLRKAGLIEVAGPRIRSARAHSISEGGIGMIYLTDDASREADQAKTIAALTGQEGISEVMTSERFAEFGLPDPKKNRQMADLIVVAKPGYAFGNTAAGDLAITEVTMDAGSQGHHGFLSTVEKMNALFIVAGAGVKPGLQLPLQKNEDIAPTIARIFNQRLPQATGQPIRGLLSE